MSKILKNLPEKFPNWGFALSVIFCYLLNGCNVVKAQNSCINPNQKKGLCISVYQCPSMLEVLNKLVGVSLTSQELDFLRGSQCSDGYGNPPYVCCTSDKNFTQQPATPTPLTPAKSNAVMPTTSNGKGNVLPVPPACGAESLFGKIYNGNVTALDEYTWMALLEYRDKSNQLVLNCGGTLINQRYILTAGHCVKGEIETAIGQLNRIRLGEYDLTKAVDCIEDDCNNEVLELGFEEVIPHPQYDPNNPNRHHDIALIRLSSDVQYTDFIRPVCLPVSATTRQTIPAGEFLTVAGWGRTLLARQSNIKMKLNVPVTDHGACTEKFSSRKVNLITSQLCAGGEFAKDSCDGDSGGPLMRKEKNDRWYLEGVVSFGNRCGLEGWPAVYTRVTDYIPWIMQTIKP